MLHRRWGPGPGIMLGYLLARAGIEVLVIEKHADFLRDFRGDTIHPSTPEVIRELGLLEEFLKLPHQCLSTVRGRIAGSEIVLAEMKYLHTTSRFIANDAAVGLSELLRRARPPLSGFTGRSRKSTAPPRVSHEDHATGAGGAPETDIRKQKTSLADANHGTDHAAEANAHALHWPRRTSGTRENTRSVLREGRGSHMIVAEGDRAAIVHSGLTQVRFMSTLVRIMPKGGRPHAGFGGRKR